jgi:hypothetical protein
MVRYILPILIAEIEFWDQREDVHSDPIYYTERSEYLMTGWEMDYESPEVENDFYNGS